MGGLDDRFFSALSGRGVRFTGGILVLARCRVFCRVDRFWRFFELVVILVSLPFNQLLYFVCPPSIFGNLLILHQYQQNGRY